MAGKDGYALPLDSRSEPNETPLPLNALNEDYFDSSIGWLPVLLPGAAWVAVWLEFPPPIKLLKKPPPPPEPWARYAWGLFANDV